MNKKYLFLILTLHAFSHSAQMVTQRQEAISNELYKATELPEDLIKIIVKYDTFVLHSNSESVLDLLLIAPSRLVATYADLTIRVWDLKTFSCEKTLKHKIDISAIAALPQNEIAAGEGDYSIKIWNLDTGICRKVLKGQHKRLLLGIVALPSHQLASASEVPEQSLFQSLLQEIAGIVIIWNVKTGDVLRTITTPRKIRALWPTQIESLPLALETDIERREFPNLDEPDIFFEHGIVFIDPETNNQFPARFEPPSHISSFASLDAHSTKFAVAGNNQKLYFHTQQQNKKYSPFWLPTLFGSFPIIIMRLDEHSLASAGWSDKKVRIIDTESIQCTEEFDVMGQATTIAPLPENKIAIGCNNGEIEIINTSPLKAAVV